MTEDTVEMEAALLEYVHSYSRYYSRSESKTLQRCKEQLFQERDMAPLVTRLEQICGSLEGARVLEIGSGSGSRAVAVALRGARVVGIEPSSAGVKASMLRARRYPGLMVSFLVGAGEELPCPAESFDLLFSTEVLQHVKRLPLVIRETARVLRSHGVCYHEAPNNLYPWEFHYRIPWLPFLPKPIGKLYARAMGKDPRHLDDINFIYRRALARLLRRNGFGHLEDLAGADLLEKAARPEVIRGETKRLAYHWFRRLGLDSAALGAILALGLHPQVRICGVRE